MAKYPSLVLNLHYSPGGAVLSSIFQGHRSLWICPWHLTIKWENLFWNPHYQVLRCGYRSLFPWLIKTTSRLWKDDYWTYDGLTHQELVLQKRKIQFYCWDLHWFFSDVCKRMVYQMLSPWDLRTKFAILLLRSNLMYMMLKKEMKTYCFLK